MKTPNPFENQDHESEWETQERAKLAVQQGRDTSHSSRLGQYRLIADALRDPLLDPLPENFARDTAVRAEVVSAASDERVESWMLQGLIVALGMAGLAVTAIYGLPLFQTIAVETQAILNMGAALGTQAAVRWSATVAVCVVFAYLLEHWRSAPRAG